MDELKKEVDMVSNFLFLYGLTNPWSGNLVDP
jgi:hypothetical protein